MNELTEKKYWYTPHEVGKSVIPITPEEEIELVHLYYERDIEEKKRLKNKENGNLVRNERIELKHFHQKFKGIFKKEKLGWV